MVSNHITIHTSPWLHDLHRSLQDPHIRYFVIYGGRGSGKSEAIAQLMIYLSIKEANIKILCARHIQHSIAESSKDRIESWLRRMGLQAHYHVTRTDIINKTNGSRFLFKGLSNITKDNITSINDIKYLWIEEAHAITEEVWQRTYPSIRAPGSRIFITFNPHYNTDILYHLFVTKPRPDAYTRQVNYNDNPWFVHTPLHNERIQDEATLPQPLYNHIWEGGLRDFSDMPVIYTRRFLVFTTPPVSCDAIILSVDTAYTTKEASDFTAIGCFAKHNLNYYLLDLKRGRFEFDTLYSTLLEFYSSCLHKFGSIHTIVIEYKASGISLAQALRTRTRLPITEYKVTKDKFSRVCEVLDILHSSFHVPSQAAWLADYTQELSRFSADDSHDHDDQVDMTSQALCYLKNEQLGNSIFSMLYLPN